MKDALRLSYRVLTAHSPTGRFLKNKSSVLLYNHGSQIFRKKSKSKNQCFVTGSFVKPSGSFSSFERTGTGDSLILGKKTIQRTGTSHRWLLEGWFLPFTLPVLNKSMNYGLDTY
jgi:hypothetical protein